MVHLIRTQEKNGLIRKLSGFAHPHWIDDKLYMKRKLKVRSFDWCKNINGFLPFFTFNLNSKMAIIRPGQVRGEGEGERARKGRGLKSETGMVQRAMSRFGVLGSAQNPIRVPGRPPGSRRGQTGGSLYRPHQLSEENETRISGSAAIELKPMVMPSLHRSPKGRPLG